MQISVTVQKPLDRQKRKKLNFLSIDEKYEKLRVWNEISVARLRWIFGCIQDVCEGAYYRVCNRANSVEDWQKDKQDATIIS